MAEETINLAQDLKKKLHEGVVSFTFKKKDGTTRTAKGTTKMDLIPEEKRPVEKTIDPNVVQGETSFQTYYDIDKQAWRSFVKSSLVSID